MSDIKLQEKLIRAGLSEKESIIYSLLLNIGGAYPSKIAELTKLNRTTTYKILTQLSIKGLVNEINKSSKLFYQIENPNKLVSYSKSQLRMSKDQLEYTEKLAPNLWEIFSSMNYKPDVKFFDGPDTLKILLDDMVDTNTGYEMLAFSNAGMLREAISKETLRDYVRAKEAKGITTKGIVPDTKEGREYNESVFKTIAKKYWPKIKFVDPKDFMFEAEITIYGEDKIAIAQLDNERMLGLILKDKAIHNMMKMIFNLAWQSAYE